MMDASELSTSQSFNVDSIVLNASRLAPRKLDISFNFIPPSTTKQAETPSFQNQLQSRLSAEHSFAGTQRDAESRIRFDLERSKALLIEQYQLTEAKLTTELSDCKVYYEQKLAEREAFWPEKSAGNQLQVNNLESKLKDVVEMCRTRIAEKDKVNMEQLEQQEHIWKERVAEVEENQRALLQAMQSKYLLERDSHGLAEKARIAAKEDQIRNKFETKMKKCEVQIQEVMRNYHDKELIIHGSLDEARKEIVLMRNAATAKEDNLRDELALKDRLILTLQAELHKVDEITKIADSWRAAARDLARMVVQACVSIQDMPPVPLAPKEESPNVFQGFGKPEEISKERQMYLLEVRAMNRLRKEHVLIQKELIARTLRNSKRIVERVRAEVVPVFDFKIEEE